MSSDLKTSSTNDTTNHGQYRILNTLGQGGYGTVFKAEDGLHSKRIVAIKFIPCISMDISYPEKELKLLRELKHQNIVKLIANYSYICKSGRENLALVMEYCPEGSLKDKLNAERLFGNQEIKSDRRYNWYLQLASAVEYIHDNGIVHRDLKPGNILVMSTDQLKVADVGIAKDVSECPNSSFDTPTHAHFAESCVGTKPYMAPEIYAKKRYGLPCDVFSLGLVFWTIAELPPSAPRVMHNDGQFSCIGEVLALMPAQRQNEVKCTAMLYPRLNNSELEEVDLMNQMLYPNPDYRPTMSIVTRLLITKFNNAS